MTRIIPPELSTAFSDVLTRACGRDRTNKLLFRRMLTAPERPDFLLVIVRPGLTGKLKVGSPNWRSADSWLMAFSESGNQQEGMLMPAYGWIETELGRFVLEPAPDRPWTARFVLA